MQKIKQERKAKISLPNIHARGTYKAHLSSVFLFSVQSSPHGLSRLSFCSAYTLGLRGVVEVRKETAQ